MNMYEGYERREELDDVRFDKDAWVEISTGAIVLVPHGTDPRYCIFLDSEV